MSDQSQGTGAPEAPQGDDAPKYVTEEQLNKAITARFTEYTKRSSAVLDDKFGGFEKKILEALPKPPADGSAPPGDAAAKSVLDHPEVKGMAKKIAELEERARKAEERTLAEERRSKDLALKQNVTEALTGANVKDPVRARHAASFLIREGLAKWNETGDALVFVESDGEVDFATGFKGWLKSDDAKLYLPSPDASASQSRPQQQRVSPTGGAPQNTDDLDFDSKLALTHQQLARAGSGLT